MQYLPSRWNALPEAKFISSLGRIPLTEPVPELTFEIFINRIPTKTLFYLSKIWHNFLSFVQRIYHKSNSLTEFPTLKFIRRSLPVNKANN